jgi:hypothetical protein
MVNALGQMLLQNTGIVVNEYEKNAEMSRISIKSYSKDTVIH